MRRISLLLIAAGALALGAKAPKDPVLLKVDGKPVTLSEFEYFYHKNDGNEVEKETPEQYLNRFIDYKLKVAQARHEQRDTTAEYRKEFQSYRREIARPYLRDAKTYNDLLEASYNHTLSNRKIDHLMIDAARRDLADSLRRALLGGADFEAIVAQYSIDPSKPQNRGHYDWIGAGQFPYEFEEAVYDTPLGQWSDVVATQYGLHVVRPTAERPYPGEVRAAHILVKMDAASDSAACKARIDSIYALLRQGREFEALARTNSDCPSSKKDGDLGFFRAGQMVPEFENVVFAMANNTVSEPFMSRFGWHIAKRYEDRRPQKDAVMRRIEENMKHDIRALRPRIARAEQLKSELKFRENAAGSELLFSTADRLGFDSASVVLKNDLTPLFYVADSVVTVADFLATPMRLSPDRGKPSRQLRERMDGRIAAALLACEERNLDAKYPEFKRQADEYAEGLMLVASLEDNVWNRPSRNPEELKAYFEANKDKYAFSEPRWKGYVIYATSDSLRQEVDAFLRDVKPAPEVLGDSLKARFPRNIRTERVVLPRGENQVIDHIAFNGPKPKFSNRFRFISTYLGHLINGPEEVADVRNRVTNDYTRELEEEFVEGLRKKYSVKVNKKVLKKVK